MSPIAAISSNNKVLSFTGNKKAKTDNTKTDSVKTDGVETDSVETGKTSKRPKRRPSFMKRRFEAKYGISYDELSEDAKKVVAKNTKFVIIATAIGAGVAGVVAFKNARKFLNGFTDALVSSGKKLLHKGTVSEGADTLPKFFLRKITSVLDKDSNVADQAVSDLISETIVNTKGKHSEILEKTTDLIDEIFHKDDFSAESINPLIEKLKETGRNDLVEEATKIVNKTETTVSPGNLLDKIRDQILEETENMDKSGPRMLNFDFKDIEELCREIKKIAGSKSKAAAALIKLKPDNNATLSIQSDEFTRLINSTLKTTVETAKTEFNDPKAYARMEKILGEGATKGLVKIFEKKKIAITNMHSLGDIAIAGGTALISGKIGGKFAGAAVEGKNNKVADEAELLEKIKEEGAQTIVKDFADNQIEKYTGAIGGQGGDLLRNILMPGKQQ